MEYSSLETRDYIDPSAISKVWIAEKKQEFLKLADMCEQLLFENESLRADVQKFAGESQRLRDENRRLQTIVAEMRGRLLPANNTTQTITHAESSIYRSLPVVAATAAAALTSTPSTGAFLPAVNQVLGGGVFPTIEVPIKNESGVHFAGTSDEFTAAHQLLPSSARINRIPRRRSRPTTSSTTVTPIVYPINTIDNRKAFECRFCGKRFYSRTHGAFILKRHEQSIHMRHMKEGGDGGFHADDGGGALVPIEDIDSAAAEEGEDEDEDEDDAEESESVPVEVESSSGVT